MFDDIVVGGGSAGAAVAARLAAGGRRVLLLEAGPDYASPEVTPKEILDPWSRPESHRWPIYADVAGRPVPSGPGRVIGGSSAINRTQVVRGAPADYDEWASLGCAGWDWNSVLPYFRRLETSNFNDDFHGQKGPVPVWSDDRLPTDPLLDAWRLACVDHGFRQIRDHNAPDATGIGPFPVNVGPAGTRVSTAMAYLSAPRSANLSVRGDCLVHRVLLEDNRAVGVVFANGSSLESARCERVIVSAGALQSPGVLMRSGIGSPHGLARIGVKPVVELPSIGAQLWDHPVVFMPFFDRKEVVARSGRSWFLRCPGEPEDPKNEVGLYMICPTPGPETVRSPVIIAVALLKPRSPQGSVELSSGDPSALPTVRYDFVRDPGDFARFAKGLRLAWELAHSPRLAPWLEPAPVLSDEVLGSDAQLRELIVRSVITMVHPSGSIPMGREGALDARCQVSGVQSLFVVDASIMPTIPRANTNLTCIMVGERVADWLLEA